MLNIWFGEFDVCPFDSYRPEHPYWDIAYNQMYEAARSFYYGF